MTTSPQGKSLRQRLHDSPAGNVLVIVIATIVILAGVWVVNTLTRSSEAAPTSSESVSQVELTGDTSGAAPKIGQAAPDFTAVATDGRSLTLSSLHGKPVWLVFGATWCANCRAETPDVQAVQDKLGDKVEIVAVNVGETMSTVVSYGQRLGLTYTQAADANTDIGSLYRVMGLPTHVFIDSNGTVSAIDVGTVTERAATDRLTALLAR